MTVGSTSTITGKKSGEKHSTTMHSWSVATVCCVERKGLRYADVCIIQSLKPTLALQSDIDSLTPLQSGRLGPKNAAFYNKGDSLAYWSEATCNAAAAAAAAARL